MKKVLLIGSSACTFAIGAKYRQSGAELFVFGNPLNPGLAEIAHAYEVGSLEDVSAICDFAKKIKPDFAFIGPPTPIVAGATDKLEAMGVPTVAPCQLAAQLESSKAFTRQLLEKYHIPGGVKHRIFTSEDGMQQFAEELNGQFVVKADGLMATMGVQVAGDHFQTSAEGLAWAKKYLSQHGRVVIEEKIIGEEFSLMSFTDGTTTVDMPPVQDFKRALIGDKGQNTAGMGAYSDVSLLPFMTKEDYETASTITRQVVAALKQELGIPYKGIMFGGFMITKNGVRCLEYNCRAGDPEGINVFSLLKTNLVDLSLAIINQELAGCKIEFDPLASVCKYVVPLGYPEAGQPDQPIIIGSLPPGVTAYTAWVRRESTGLVMAGQGRAIALLAKADTLRAAEQLAEAGCVAVKGPVYHRRDIASAETIAKKIAHMKFLRGS